MNNLKQKRQPRSITTLQWNCRSILWKLPEFKNYLMNLNVNPDVICLQETFLSSNHNPKLPGYIMRRKDPCTGGSGGGVAIFVKSDIYFADLRIFGSES